MSDFYFPKSKLNTVVGIHLIFTKNSQKMMTSDAVSITTVLN